MIDIGNVSNNNTVHDELYTGFIVQTKSYTITSTGCSGGVPAGTWCPGGILKYTVDVRNIAVARERHDARVGDAERVEPAADRRRLATPTPGRKTAAT